MLNQVYNKANQRAFYLASMTFVLLTLCGVAMAEYRVYQYYVKSRIHNPKDAEAYQVISTLDPVTYKAYHGGDNAIRVDLVRTWTCPGHTGNRKPICDAPDDLSMDVDEDAVDWNRDGN